MLPLRLLLLLTAAATVASATAAATCTDDSDCSLAGACVSGTGPGRASGGVSLKSDDDHTGGEKKKPHVLLILADDYGWNDVGYHTDPTAVGYHNSANPDGHPVTNAAAASPQAISRCWCIINFDRLLVVFRVS